MKTIPAYLLVVFCGFYLNVINLSPVYMTFLLASFFLFFIDLGRIKVESFCLYNLFLLLYFTFIEIFFIGEFTHSFINIVFSLIYGTLTYFVLYPLSRDAILSIAEKFICFSIIIVSIETCWRITHPQLSSILISSGIEYYQYKYSSIMFTDSNFTALFLVTVLFLARYLDAQYQLNLKKHVFFLWILLLLTFSKAAIATTIACVFLFSNISKKDKIAIVMTIGTIALFFFYRQVIYDGSLQGRLNIILDTFSYAINLPIATLFFGTGFGSLIKLDFMAGHNLIASFIIESGLIGAIVYFSSWFYFIKKYNDTVNIILPVFIASMSTGSHINNYMLVALAIIIILKGKKYRI